MEEGLSLEQYIKKKRPTKVMSFPYMGFVGFGYNERDLILWRRDSHLNNI